MISDRMRFKDKLRSPNVAGYETTLMLRSLAKMHQAYLFDKLIFCR